MLVALYGPSCVGKTTIGNALSAATNRMLRSCGQIVRNQAQLLGVEADDLPDCKHHEVDSATRDWLVENPTGIVEGRYLDYVLATSELRPFLVQLTAADEVRQKRWQDRVGPSFRMDDWRRMDEADAALIARIYPGVERLTPDFILDTSSVPVAECARQVQQRIVS